MKIEVPKEKRSGYFIKSVRTTKKPDEFTPWWPRFHSDGRGGAYRDCKGTHAVRTVYKLGREYRVRHKLWASSDSPSEGTFCYSAGVHGWHSVLYVATTIAHGLYNDGKLVLFSYKQAVAMDFQVTVAMKVTPVAIIPDHIFNYPKNGAK